MIKRKKNGMVIFCVKLLYKILQGLLKIYKKICASKIMNNDFHLSKIQKLIKEEKLI